MIARLERLDLHGNRITVLEANVFAETPLLAELVVDAENLQTIETGTFNGLSNLVELHMHCNMLLSLPDGVFNGLENLRVLDLHDNSLPRLPIELFTAPVCHLRNCETRYRRQRFRKCADAAISMVSTARYYRR